MSSKQSVIEAVLGVDTTLPPEEAFTQAHQNIMGYSTDYEAAGKMQQFLLTGRVDFPDIHTAEEVTATVSIYDAVNRDELSHHANTLVNWAVYEEIMRNVGEKSGGRALLVGSYSPLSSLAFKVLAEDIYGADETYIVDVVSSHAKEKQKQFVYGNGLALPFADGSMNFIHTNSLIHMLRGINGGRVAIKAGVSQLMSEFGRVLAPGGQLLMRELTPRIDNQQGTEGAIRATDKLRGFIHNQLISVEFEEVITDYIGRYVDKSHLFDPERDFSNVDHFDPSSFALYARKLGVATPIALPASSNPC